jgi:HSP20 family protein
MIGWRFYDSNPLRDALEQMAAEHRRRPGRGEPMPINVYEDSGAVVVEAALPAVTAERVDLSCSEGLLTIRARADIPEREYIHQEMGTVDYLRQVVLPGDCRFDEAEASFDSGILTIRVPKVKLKTPEKIRIQVTKRDSGQTLEAHPGSGYSEVKTPIRKRRPKAQ